MIEQLEDRHVVAVAMLSYLYYHPEPMSLIASESQVGGVVDIALWLNLEDGDITCRQRKVPVLKSKKGEVRLPNTAVPVKLLADNHDLSGEVGREQFAFSVLKHLIFERWSYRGCFNDLGIDAAVLDKIKLNLSGPVLTTAGAKSPLSFIENVLLPVLYEGSTEQKVLH